MKRGGGHLSLFKCIVESFNSSNCCFMPSNQDILSTMLEGNQKGITGHRWLCVSGTSTQLCHGPLAGPRLTRAFLGLE